jgi:YegS/Rv2252/BmrU family lipid kinase
MPVPVEVIINAGAGTVLGVDVRKRLADSFSENELEARITLAKSGAEVVEMARRAAAGWAQTIVAGGGDGTINAVAAPLVGTNKQLGVLPLGTLNHFAKDLGLPLDLAAAVRTIREGYAVNIDVGEVNGRIFLNNSGLGLYPSIVHHREEQQRQGLSKWPAFIRALLTVLRRHPFLDVRLVAEGKKITGRTPFVFVGNNEYETEGLNLGGRACLDAGRLCLFITRHVGRIGLLQLALRALFGGLRESRDFLALCSTEAWIETRQKRVRVARDGEVEMMESPLYYRVRPGALRVIVPAGDAAKAQGATND